MELMDTSVFPGQSASWMCKVPSTIYLQFTWYLNNQINLIETGSYMDTTASSSYTLYNVNYIDNNSTVRCSAAGSSLVVNSSVVYLTGKSLLLALRLLFSGIDHIITYVCRYKAYLAVIITIVISNKIAITCVHICT